MKTTWTITVLYLLGMPGGSALAQPLSVSASLPSLELQFVRGPGLEGSIAEFELSIREAEPAGSGDKKKDPGYELYKVGYHAILNEDWAKARKEFRDLISRYTTSDHKHLSEYVDDAAYWSAYAFGHLEIDKEKAFTAFKEFIVKYPESNYFDDAVAEMHRLKSGESVYYSGDASSTAIAPGGTLFTESVGKGGYSYSYAVAPRIQAARQLRQLTRRVGSIGKVPTAQLFPPGFSRSNEKIDPETRLKMDALQAIGATKEDSISFQTLRDVAVDTKQALTLRETAMDALSNFSHFDVLPVFLEVAKRDTSEELQNIAIDYMGQISRNKNRSFETLAELFSAIPKTRVTQLQAVLGSVAEIGNEKAVDFLARVAKTEQNYDLRREAIYYLGNIGGDKARAALYEILKGK